MTHTVYILLGANLGDRANTLQRAREALQADIGPILLQSSLYETAAWGLIDQPAFLNQVLSIQSVLSPDELLTKTQSIEQRLGRIRHKKWGARLIDIDILYIDDLMLHSNELIVPHPFLAARRFTLVPLAEIAPNLIHPTLGYTTQELLEICPDKEKVKRY